MEDDVTQAAIRYFAALQLLGRTQAAQRHLVADPSWRAFLDEGTVPTDVDAEQLARACRGVSESFARLPRQTTIIRRAHTRYPTRLQAVPEPPEFLFAAGDLSLLELPVVSIVGTRAPTEGGVIRARQLSAWLAFQGIVVASGLARGIDRAAHEGTLAVGGNTIAVLGTPLHRAYPREHAALQRIIRENGLLLSQFSPGAAVTRDHFPQRKAVMSGISLATVVMEAGETSGALIQADMALKQGRLVLIPQSAVDNPAVDWPARLLRRSDRARVFHTLEDVQEILRPWVMPRDSGGRRRPLIGSLAH